MPNRTYINKEEKSMPGHKPMKGRTTILVYVKANGDCKIKPLVIYHLENPRIFKRNKVMKNKLPLCVSQTLSLGVPDNFLQSGCIKHLALK